MTPWTGRLLLANVLVFALTAFGAPWLQRELALVPALLLERPWTAVTYMFLHADGWHLAANMIGLFFFGPRLEVRLGGVGFLGLYFTAGLVGAAAFGVFSPGNAVVGASGAVFGVLVGFARYWPRERLLIWGVFPMQARVLAALLVGFSLYAGFTGAQGGIAHFAHLGGVAGGWAFLALRDRRAGRRGPVHRVLREKKREIASRPGRRKLKEWESIDPEGLHEVNRENLERIRSKIEESGPESLSRREREFMDRLAARSED